MKSFAVLAAFVASALAQGINLAAPAPNSTVFPGQFITVEVDRPNPLSSFTEVALVLSMVRCPSSGCSADALGQILYNGPYNPQPHPEAGLSKPPHQNFSIPVPTSLAPGDTVSLIATHFNLVGAGPSPNIDTRFMTLNVVKGP